MLVNALLGLIGLEFLTGIGVNLEVTSFPSSLGVLFGPSAASYSPLLLAHAALGIILGILALVTVVLASRLQDRVLLLGSVSGLGSVLLAAIAGAGFLGSGGVATYSFVMAVGFLGAFWSYFRVRVRLSALEGT
jgi:O-antigen/teichoic acid export membrane protein